MSYGALVDSEICHAIALNAHPHQIVFAFEINAHVGIMTIHVKLPHSATFHVLMWQLTAHTCRSKMYSINRTD